MKKTFRTILAGALSFLAVSCYDDSALRKQNELLQSELEKLKESLVDASEFGIDRENGLFLPFEASKTLSLTAENVAEYYVMNEPDGWQASIEGTTLTIVAPAKEAYSHGAAALTGEITIHATSNGGACKIAKLAVEAGNGLSLTVDKDGNAVVKNAFTTEGTEGTEFASFAVGVMNADMWYNFEEQMMMGSFEDVWNQYASMMSQICAVYPSYYEYNERPAYVDGTYEVDQATINLNAFYNMFMYQELPKGSYVVFAFPVDAEYKIAGDIIETVYAYSTFQYGEYTATHNDVTINLAAEGADSYFVGVCPSYKYANIPNPTFDGYMNLASEGPWEGFSKFGATYGMGQEWYTVPESINVSEILGEKLMADETYHVWVMPVFNHMVKSSVSEYGEVTYDYSAFDYNTDFKPYVIDVKTNALAAGGPETIIEAGAAAFDNVSAKITLSEGQTAFYGVFTAEEYSAFDLDDAKMKQAIMDNVYETYLMTQRPSPVLTATETVTESVTFGSTESLYFIAFTISADGKAGECEWIEVAPKTIVRDESIRVNLTSLVEENGQYKATFNVEGATNIFIYNISASADNTSTINSVEKTFMTKSGSIYNTLQPTITAVNNGVATVSFAKSTSKKDIFVWAYEADSNGDVAKMIETPAIFNIAESLAQ